MTYPNISVKTWNTEHSLILNSDFIDLKVTPSLYVLPKLPLCGLKRTIRMIPKTFWDQNCFTFFPFWGNPWNTENVISMINAERYSQWFLTGSVTNERYYNAAHMIRTDCSHFIPGVPWGLNAGKKDILVSFFEISGSQGVRSPY